jgi:iron complex transport system ATP-binding protein
MNTVAVSRGWSEPSGELAAHDVHLRRGGRPVLQAVNLRAQPGRLLALVGPNGAGKSSLLGVLAGLLVPTRGQAMLDGRLLAEWPPAALARRRAMLSQQVRLGFGFRVDEVVMLGRSPYAVRRDSPADHRIAEAALHAAHAWHLRGRDYLELSGGEQQRVQLARVLAQVWEGDDGARWLLLDEPEAGLDIAHQHFVLRRARLLACQGYGVIAVLHDLNLAARYADEVALLERGRLLRHGPPGEALEPRVLSDVYGLPMRRVETGDRGWILAPL